MSSFENLGAYTRAPCRTAARQLQLSRWCFKIALARQGASRAIMAPGASRRHAQHSSSCSITTGCCWARIFKVSYVNNPAPLQNSSSCRRRRSARRIARSPGCGPRACAQSKSLRACSGACRRSSPPRSCKENIRRRRGRGEFSFGAIVGRASDVVRRPVAIAAERSTLLFLRARGTRVGGDAPSARPGGNRRRHDVSYSHHTRRAPGLFVIRT